MIERRQTNQRQWVLDTIRDYGHMSAQAIYQKIKDQHPDISVATVYRNLNILLESGFVQIVGHSSQKEIYDARTDVHAHFICRDCGLIEDIEVEPDQRAIQLLQARGHQITSNRISLLGRCPTCAQNKAGVHS
ncbi:MAG: transcriptional repressor [Eubacteriales bacterium]|nr:transcriptional repressor [Eubacteriales bacterium]